MHLDPTSLRLFISVIEEKTIAAAAEREHIAAAAVSKRMSELEEQLKTQLLVRTNKGIQPTNAGMALASMARRALRELDDIAVSMREYASGARGFIRVFANISALTQFLPGDLQSFSAAYPNIQLQLEEKISPAILKAVHENAADVGIFSGMPPGRDVEILPYRRDTLAVIAPAGHPLLARPDFRFADTLAYDFVGLHTGSAINQIVANAADRLELPLRVKVQVTGFDTLCFMVNAGLGLGVLPLGIATLYARIFDIGILRIQEPWARRELQICVRSFDALPTAAKLFVEHLTGKARPVADEADGTDDADPRA
ncbi:LysR family transcriptional regulator [Bordetella genomosp. 9]|uniref:LysR family transcriptional regulator n=1 Tax=Bordetella genomosp. 9 TaxID=1416803 RepID=A0A261RQD6_9BORD|nr:LysR family transcriptional regulator [Bordetella genomosp. 9]OZI26882.1 LysR family transcriptional regulator [Bordetella genomosp. 9]